MSDLNGTPVSGGDIESLKFEIQQLKAQLDQNNKVKIEDNVKELISKAVSVENANEATENFYQALMLMNKASVKEPEQKFPPEYEKEALNQLNAMKTDTRFKDLDSKILENIALDKAKLITETRKFNTDSGFNSTVKPVVDNKKQNNNEIFEAYKKVFPGYSDEFYTKLTNNYTGDNKNG